MTGVGRPPDPLRKPTCVKDQNKKKINKKYNTQSGKTHAEQLRKQQKVNKYRHDNAHHYIRKTSIIKQIIRQRSLAERFVGVRNCTQPFILV